MTARSMERIDFLAEMCAHLHTLHACLAISMLLDMTDSLRTSYLSEQWATSSRSATTVSSASNHLL